LEKVLKALAMHPPGADRDRALPRTPVSGQVTMLPFKHGRSGRARAATVHDISAAGVAVIADESLSIGTQFKLLIPRRFRRSIEVLCTARHCRPHGDRFVIGAEYGVSWLETLGTLVGPPPAAKIATPAYPALSVA
jgi:hypothetical protein